ncbi:MAG: Gfo/Idh/MocA family oxidoreductase [Pseudomonadota bacterium]
MRIGCLGAARIAPAALIEPARQLDGVTVTAIAARDRSRAEEFAQTHDISGIETDYKTLIARSDVDIVYNALPPSRHSDLTIAALEAGKPVLCEKPFAMNAVEAKRMAEAAQRTGVLLMEAFHYRFHPAFARALDVVNSGALGSIIECEAEFSAEIADRPNELRHIYELGGGALMDLGCYPLHWSRTLLPGEPKIVSATAVCGRPNVDLTTEAELVFANDVNARIRTSMAKGTARTAWFRITGTDAALHMFNPLAAHFGYKLSIERDGQSEVISEGTAGGPTTYDHQLRHFVDCLNGKAEPILTLEDAVANMTAIDAIYKAAGLPARQS